VSLSSSGTTATAVTAKATTLAVGDVIHIVGANPATYHGEFTVSSVLSPTTFTYTLSAVPSSSVATGAISLTSFTATADPPGPPAGRPRGLGWVPPGQGRTASGTNDGVGSRAGGFSAGGQRTTDNNYLLDGFDNNTDDTSFDTNQAEVIKPSVDAIQEFKVQTNSFDAQQGYSAGGTVNVAVKSGTNDMHGSVYYFNRDRSRTANTKG